MKVLHLPTAVGGNSFGLARAENNLGCDSKVLIAEPFRYGQAGDINLNLQDGQNPPLKLLKLIKAFLKHRSQFDVFHFNYGISLINFPRYHFVQADLPFYPKRAKLFVTYNGCDARQKFPTMQRTPIAACHQEGCYGGMCNSGERDKLRRMGIEKMSRHVKHVWALNPDLLRFLPPEKSSFLPYTLARWDDLPFCPVDFGKKRLRIVHAPTDREAKGTGFIISALENLADKYPGCIEICLLENMDHDQLIKNLMNADLVVDQILIGWYGALAAEAMKMGKPVVARIAEDDMKFLPDKMAEEVRGAVINAEPATILDVIEKCHTDREFLKQRAEAGTDYANRWHDPVYVGGITTQKYEESNFSQ